MAEEEAAIRYPTSSDPSLLAPSMAKVAIELQRRSLSPNVLLFLDWACVGAISEDPRQRRIALTPDIAQDWRVRGRAAKAESMSLRVEKEAMSCVSYFWA